MHILINILLIIAGILAFLLLLALFLKKKHYAQTSIIIDAPLHKVFDYIKLLKNQDSFNEGAMAGTDRKREYRGTDGTIGFVYAWSGDKDAGEGEKEILNIVEGKRMEAEIRFKKPMAVTAIIVMETEALSPTQTKLSWSNAGKLNYPFNILIPILEKSVTKGMDRSLYTLKGILEK